MTGPGRAGGNGRLATRSARAVLLCAWLVPALPGTAAAHAFLAKADPEVGSTVSAAPAELWIDFTQDVEPAFSRIAVTDAAGARVDRNDAHAEGGGSRLAIGLKPLPPGRYLVTWQAISVDTHRTQGSFSFTVAP